MTDPETIFRRRWAILGVLCLSVFLAVVDNTIVNVALPSMSAQLHASTSQLQWIVDGYSLVFAMLLLVGGSLGDRYGRKGALQIGIFAFAAFSALAGLSGSTSLLIVARCLMGVAAALVFPATLAILTNTFTDAKERATAIGAWTGVVGLAVALGPLTGGVLLKHFWWGSIFFVNLPIAAIALGLGARLVPTSRDPAAPPLDLVGFVLSGVGIGALVYTTIEAPGRGWLAALTVGGYAIGLVVLGAFALWERRSPHPMLDVALFTNIRFTAASFSITVSFFGLFGFIFLITQYFQLVRGYDTLSAGVHTLPFAIATGAIAPIATPIAHRIGTKIVVPVGLIMMSAGFLIATTFKVDTPYFGPVVMSMVLIAAGLGLVAAPSTDAILAVLPPAKAGVGSAVNDVTRELGGAFGVAVVGAAFSSVYAPSLARLLRGVPIPASALGAAKQSTAAALGVAQRMPAGARDVVVGATRSSFIDGLGRGSMLCAGVTLLGALFAFVVLPRRLPSGHHADAMAGSALSSEPGRSRSSNSTR